MVSDSVANASAPALPNSKELGKKKRANRNAKLKQCKLDARREQWLSQGDLAGKNKGGKEEQTGIRSASRKGSGRSLENLEMSRRGSGRMDGSIHHGHDSDSESPSNSPTSVTGSVLGGTDSGTSYAGSSSSSSGGCCSGCISEEEEEGDDGCLDDWEAVADALAANDKQQAPCSDPPAEHGPVSGVDSRGESTNRPGSVVGNSKGETARTATKSQGISRAWRPDDVFRPQSLPNLSKQRSFPNSDWHPRGGIAWASSAPSACPICYEDLDFTDSSFLPCLCGFRLCLFCHKRILEEDGRCPGCRKPYQHDPVEAEPSVHGGSLTFRLARSCSMVTRS